VSDNFVITIALGLVATLFGMLMLLLGWLGSRLYTKIDELGKAIITLTGELHSKINVIDGRLIRVEAKHELCETASNSLNRRAADTKNGEW
jgi:hypothetical protein